MSAKTKGRRVLCVRPVHKIATFQIQDQYVYCMPSVCAVLNDDKIGQWCRYPFWGSPATRQSEGSPNTTIECTPEQSRTGGGLGVQLQPPEILKALQNRAKLNPIVKTVKIC
jgi:hypothetical protein